MTTIKTFQNNEILKAEDMNNIGSNINEISSVIENIPHSDSEYPSRLKVGQGLEFDIDDYNNQTLFGKYNATAPDTDHYLLFAIGDGSTTLPTNAIEVLKKIEVDEGQNPYDLRIGGVSLIQQDKSYLQKLEAILNVLKGEQENTIEKKLDTLPTVAELENKLALERNQYLISIKELSDLLEYRQDTTYSKLMSFETKLDELENALSNIIAILEDVQNKIKR